MKKTVAVIVSLFMLALGAPVAMAQDAGAGAAGAVSSGGSGAAGGAGFAACGLICIFGCFIDMFLDMPMPPVYTSVFHPLCRGWLRFCCTRMQVL